MKLSHTGKGQTKKIKRFHYIQNAVSKLVEPLNFELKMSAEYLLSQRNKLGKASEVKFSRNDMYILRGSIEN